MAVEDPDAKISIDDICPPESIGYMLRATAVDPRRMGKPYRYIYGNCIIGPRPCNSINATCRINVMDGTVVTWNDLPNAIAAGPPTFIPRPGAEEDDENDGVVLLDYLGADGCALMVVLDGESFAEVARVRVPYRQCVSTGNTWIFKSDPGA